MTMSCSTSHSPQPSPAARAFSVIRKVWNHKALLRGGLNQSSSRVTPSRQRRVNSLSETPFDTDKIAQEIRQNGSQYSSVLYLAYGSNLSAETFKGARGINPLSQVNVLVPELELTFDLPGIPYNEPCFANTRYRSPPDSKKIAESKDYHKDRWHKGLVGVVYEVTMEDYATIIATEGGGSGYQDVVVQCYEIPEGTRIVNPHPTSASFKAHTLFAPAIPPSEPGSPPPSKGGRVVRPDPSYAQPSARYLKLITDGAEEHNLPTEYKDFLYQLRPYTITSTRQNIGRFIFLSIWMPIIATLLSVSRLFAGDNGKLPEWMITIVSAVFAGVWISYDGIFKKAFGDGERTQNGGDEEAILHAVNEKRPLLVGKQRNMPLKAQQF